MVWSVGCGLHSNGSQLRNQFRSVATSTMWPSCIWSAHQIWLNICRAWMVGYSTWMRHGCTYIHVLPLNLILDSEVPHQLVNIYILGDWLICMSIYRSMYWMLIQTCAVSEKYLGIVLVHKISWWMEVLGNGKLQNSFRKLRYNNTMEERKGQDDSSKDKVSN